MKLVEGQLVHHRYRLDRRLAQGGMGEVWKGFDIQLGRIVAVKALRTDTSNVEAKLRRLEQKHIIQPILLIQTLQRCLTTTSMMALVF